MSFRMIATAIFVAVFGVLFTFALDQEGDAKAIDLASAYCGEGAVRSIDTTGLFSRKVVCENGIKHSL